ncbi:MAG: PaaI family thioesterase [Jatrophihabitantaceae bacterium]
MDATSIAKQLLESIPANQLIGLQVHSACDGSALVGLSVQPNLTNVIGSLHSGGLISLADAAGLAAVLSVATEPRQLMGITPLGSDADLTFFSPARGELAAHCVLDDPAREQVEALLNERVQKVALMTDAEITDESGAVVCTGRFRWRIRRSKQLSAAIA